MHVRTESILEDRLAEALMCALFPCDLGDGIEVIHDVEQIEIELDCDLDDDHGYSAPYAKIEIQCAPAAVIPAIDDAVSSEPVAALTALSLHGIERNAAWDTLPFAPYEPSEVREPPGVAAMLSETVPYPRSEEGETIPFVKHSAPRRGTSRQVPVS